MSRAPARMPVKERTDTHGTWADDVRHIPYKARDVDVGERNTGKVEAGKVKASKGKAEVRVDGASGRAGRKARAANAGPSIQEEGTQFVNLLPSAKVRAWYLAHLAQLPLEARTHKGRLLDELVDVLDHATLASINEYLHNVATGQEDTEMDEVDPFLLLLILPHDTWPINLPRLAGVV
jgi:hypothetical protein